MLTPAPFATSASDDILSFEVFFAIFTPWDSFGRALLLLPKTNFIWAHR